MSGIAASYHFMQFQGKRMIQTQENGEKTPILRKFSDRRKDGRTDESDLIGRCPTDVECPIEDANMKSFCENYTLKSLIKQPT